MLCGVYVERSNIVFMKCDFLFYVHAESLYMTIHTNTSIKTYSSISAMRKIVQSVFSCNVTTKWHMVFEDINYMAQYLYLYQVYIDIHLSEWRPWKISTPTRISWHLYENQFANTHVSGSD